MILRGKAELHGIPDPIGVPEHIFKPGDGVVELAHGSSVAYSVSKDGVEIKDTSYLDSEGKPIFQMAAHVTERWSEDEVRAIRIMDFVVCTYNAGSRPRRHPDLRAKGLLNRTIAYLEDEEPLTYLRGSWNWTTPSMSTNYNQFVKALRQQPGNTLEDMRQAALVPWTGQLAAENGFTQVSSIEPTYNGYTVLFNRPPQSIRQAN